MIVALVIVVIGCNNREADAPKSAESREEIPQEITFSGQISSLVWDKCAGCHRPGESAPFSLITYEDVANHAKQILEVTKNGYMPPWMPERDGKFKGQRGLSSNEMSMLQTWVEQGMRKGNLDTMAAPPKWTEGWELGVPDLILELPRSYSLSAQGPDEYRN